MELRTIIEPNAAKLAAKRATQEDRVAVRRAFRAMERAVAGQGVAMYLRLWERQSSTLHPRHPWGMACVLSFRQGTRSGQRCLTPSRRNEEEVQAARI